MQGYVPRKIQGQIEARLADFPVVAVLGSRQCGKTTLVQETVGGPGVVYLDLERPSDLGKLRDPELFFTVHRSQGTASLFCLDEIQRVPEIFPLLRSLVDEERRNGQFLLLGSASRDLLRQTSETLGRPDHLPGADAVPGERAARGRSRRASPPLVPGRVSSQLPRPER